MDFTALLQPRVRRATAAASIANHGSATSLLLSWPNEVGYLRKKTQQSNDVAGKEQGEVCLDFVGSAPCTATKEERQRGKECGKQY